ncbi:GrpB family protein [Gimesia maris]|uniref:GrpB family protein n=1 Tax=Gimesia maris TaxID=122 RepID=UPI0032F00A20
MSLFDYFIPDPPLHCPACGRELKNWQGKEGPCFQLTWQQGIKFPVASDCELTPDSGTNQNWKETLPATFLIYADGCACDRLVEAYGTCENEVWVHSEVVTHHNFQPGSTTSLQDERKIRRQLKQWIEQGPTDLHAENDDNRETGLIGGVEQRVIELVEYNTCWPERFEHHAEKIRDVLGDQALTIEHIGSTSVPGLAAKPIVDLLLVVVDSSDENAYLPQLLSAGYELRVREPDFQEHRMFRTPARDVHLHLFSEGSPEIIRLLMFRDWLRSCPEDRQRYEQVKRELVQKSWPDMNAYAAAKSSVIEQILNTAFTSSK